LDELTREFLHVGERFEPARIGIFEPELGMTIVIGGAQPAVHRGTDMALAELLVTAGLVEICNSLPFPVPALLVPGDHAAGGEETFGDGTAALLRFAQRTTELVAHPRIFRPMVPTVRLIDAVRHVRDLIDQKLFRHDRRNSLVFFSHAHRWFAARALETLAGFFGRSSDLNFVHYCFHSGQQPAYTRPIVR